MANEPANRRDFAGFYRATLGPLRHYLTRFLRNPTEAEDVAHDAYLRVYPTEGKTPARKPEALLYTTARRLAINRLQRHSRSPFAGPAHPESTASSAPGVVQQVIARQDLQQLEDAIAELPAGCRQVLLLRKVDLLSHQEIAARLDITVSTVEKQHARALRLLRTALACLTDANPSAAITTKLTS